MRTIVAEILQDHGYASPAELQGLRDEVRQLGRTLSALQESVRKGQEAAAVAEAEVALMRAELEAERAKVALAGERAARAEALAMATDGRVASLLDRSTALEALVAQAERRATMAEARLDEALTLELDTRALQSVQLDDDAEAVEVVEAPQAVRPDTVVPAIVPLTQAACKVDGCVALGGTDAFCLRHHQDWVAGRLAGFVSPEGLVDVDGAPFRVDEEHAGLPYEVSGAKVRRVRVDGRFVKKTAL